MDYEKLYKETLEKARIFKEHLIEISQKGFADEMEYIFPELAESEDERIRKDLIKWINEFPDTIWRGHYKKDVIAWLEKQGKNNSCKFTFEDVLALECSMKTAKITKGGDELYKILVPLYNKIHDAYLIEKQGEQKPYGQRQECVDCQFNYAGECKGYCTMKKDEQKSADKVEPKFKVGDWIVWQNKCYKVNYNDCGYKLIDQNGLGTSLEYGTIDENAHLWTIADAKDGDVLYLQHDGKEHIIIYKGVIKERFRTFVSAYCAYNGIVDAFCFADVSRYADIAYGGIMPATKEQRELLFEKMKEESYEWDNKKKELKKIEHNENERISKEIIQYIKALNKDGYLYDEEWIAWLEKQGNTNDTTDRAKFVQAILRGAAINLITWIDYNAAEGNICLSNVQCKDIENALVRGDWDKIYGYIKKKLEKQEEL